MKPVSVNEDGSVVFEFDNLRQHTRYVGVKELVKIHVSKDKLMQAQAAGAHIGRLAGNSGKRIKDFLVPQ